MNKNLLKKGIKRALKFNAPEYKYTKYYHNLKLDEYAVVFESQHGTGIHGNVFYMLRSMVQDSAYANYKLFLSCRKGNKERFREMLNRNGMERVELVELFSKRYFKLMASAKYLVNDNTFLPFFVKKDGQVYLNTWHGTPLKTLGKKIQNAMYGIGNTQKNFFMADYLLYPNEYTMEHMVEDYMLENLSQSKIVLSGYPRNTAFYDTQRAQAIREELELTDKKVYAFMPTWRGAVGAIDPKANVYVQYYLYEMDKRLGEDEILYVNLHPIAKKNVNFCYFEHIREFPGEYETYEFLNVADCLITDYSSVFYDFAVSGKKCVLFTYDREEYFADRGVYRSLDTLPFPKVTTVDELFLELRSTKNYDDSAFLKEYCSYDHPDAAKDLCRLLIFGKSSSKMDEREIVHNGKENVLLYVGNLSQNGITTSVLNLLHNLDCSEKNYYVTFRAGLVKPNQETLLKLPQGVNYIATTGKMNLSFFKKVFWVLIKYHKAPLKPVMKWLQKDLKMDLRRHYGTIPIDSIVHFTGYEDIKILLYSAFEKNNVIYVHSDMEQEVKVRKNQRKNVLEYAYKHYDHVALVAEDLLEVTRKFLKKPRPLDIAHNVIDYQGIQERGKQELAFDSYTCCNKTFEEVQSIVQSDAKKLVSVGRFSPEKGHRRLIEAFSKVLKDEPNSYLFIIGGNQYNGLYDELTEYVETLPYADRIVLILSMSNPLPLVKACDGFVLSSFYEGFGLVLVEADILGVPGVSTDITGPRLFMQKHGGVLVPNSTEGIEQGIRKLFNGEVKLLTADYEEYNNNAINEFLALL